MREIETKRLFLRKLRKDDAESIFRNWASDSEVAKYVTWSAHKDINETKAILDMWLAEYDNDNCYRYGIENKADGELIGMIECSRLSSRKSRDRILLLPQILGQRIYDRGAGCCYERACGGRIQNICYRSS